MAVRRRKAEYVTTLIYVDEPQLVLLKSATVYLLAVAVPSESPEEAKFLGVTTTAANFERYRAGNSDLRYLFTYPNSRVLYYFDLMKMDGKSVWMEPAPAAIPEQDLPLPRIFATHHTHPWEPIERAAEVETLAIDGKWEMQEFGYFYQKYADIYAAVLATKNWMNDQLPQAIRTAIKSEFLTKPFQGGFSYVNLFDDLFDRIPLSQRPSLKKVRYASPGSVLLTGDAAIFGELESIVMNYLANREQIYGAYLELRQYLSQAHLLKLAGNNYFKNDPTAAYVENESRSLSDLLGAFEFDTIMELTDGNALVAAKVVLAMVRRVDESSAFFAQGRMSFTNGAAAN